MMLPDSKVAENFVIPILRKIAITTASAETALSKNFGA
ncbi:hypothetical protein CES85_5208 [Ochrobactrum quorumnocens]|uniref:Uncharacterized protein n=1 Tax=Ochrobactrum quorumnocens TaxID=271865 RepID=A0A248UCM5_9HYPH|nr:hypothetical protein CES85_5208 [[Ochrobactrum] quorumnocens]